MGRLASPYYGRLIKEATGVKDDNTVAEVEDIMRCEYSTLDHLTRQRFFTLARISYTVWKEMNQNTKGDKSEDS